jgi:hypothetical protein
MLRKEQTDRLHALTPDQLTSLYRYHPEFPTPPTPSIDLLITDIHSRNYDHATLLRPLLRTTDPTTLTALEALLGKPITRISRPTRHANPTRLTRQRPTKVDPRTITNIQPNPKRPGSASFARYSLYRENMSVTEAIQAGVTTADVRWDSERGYITLT